VNVLRAIGDGGIDILSAVPDPDRSRPDTRKDALFRDKQRRRLTRPESRLAARSARREWPDPCVR
jgi:hypothetical protein